MSVSLTYICPFRIPGHLITRRIHHGGFITADSSLGGFITRLTHHPANSSLNSLWNTRACLPLITSFMGHTLNELICCFFSSLHSLKRHNAFSTNCFPYVFDLISQMKNVFYNYEHPVKDKITQWTKQQHFSFEPMTMRHKTEGFRRWN